VEVGTEDNVLLDLVGARSLHGEVEQFVSSEIIIAGRALESLHAFHVRDVILVFHQLAQVVERSHHVVRASLFVD